MSTMAIEIKNGFMGSLNMMATTMHIMNDMARMNKLLLSTPMISR